MGKKSTMKFTEAKQLVEGDLDNQDFETVIEVKGVLNKVKTNVSDMERKVDKVLKEKAESAPKREYEQIDFDDIIFNPEVREEKVYKYNSRFIINELEKASDPDLVRDCIDKKINKSVFEHIVATNPAKLPSSIAHHVTEHTVTSFDVRREKRKKGVK